jgi:hypothetical protein
LRVTYRSVYVCHPLAQSFAHFYFPILVIFYIVWSYI